MTTATTEQPPALDGSFEIVPAEIGLDIAAKAPDREKLIKFADTVRALSPGEMATAAGNQIVGEIADQVAKFAAWIEKKAATL